MVKYREILRLTAMGISQRNVAFSVGCAPSTVQDVLRAAKAVGLEWPLPEEMDSETLGDNSGDCGGRFHCGRQFRVGPGESY